MTEAETVAGAGRDGEHVLDGAADLDAGDIVAFVGAQRFRRAAARPRAPATAASVAATATAVGNPRATSSAKLGPEITPTGDVHSGAKCWCASRTPAGCSRSPEQRRIPWKARRAAHARRRPQARAPRRGNAATGVATMTSDARARRRRAWTSRRASPAARCPADNGRCSAGPPSMPPARRRGPKGSPRGRHALRGGRRGGPGAARSPNAPGPQRPRLAPLRTATAIACLSEPEHLRDPHVSCLTVAMLSRRPSPASPSCPRSSPARPIPAGRSARRGRRWARLHRGWRARRPPGRGPRGCACRRARAFHPADRAADIAYLDPAFDRHDHFERHVAPEDEQRFSPQRRRVVEQCAGLAGGAEIRADAQSDGGGRHQRHTRAANAAPRSPAPAGPRADPCRVS